MITRQIPEVEGVQDKKAGEIMKSLKSVVEGITGRLPNKTPIVKLGADATLAGVINKVNEILSRLQEES